MNPYADVDDLFAWADANGSPAALAEQAEPERKSIEERCAEFDAAHPEVYAEIKRLALDAHARGRRRLGIGFLAELARWNLTTDAHDGEGFKVNSDYRAIWVRRLIVECPELAGMFETRARRAA